MVVHFFCLLFLVRKTPLWCLDSNLHSKKRLFLHKFSLDAGKSKSPFEVRHPLLGGQWEHTRFNTWNKDTYQTEVKEVAPTWQSMCNTLPHPFLASTVPWGDLQGAEPQVIPVAYPRTVTAAALSHQHTSSWSRWSSAPCWALNRTHTLGSSLLWGRGICCIPTAQQYCTFTVSGPHKPDIVLQIFGVSNQMYSPPWQPGSGQRL